MRLYTQPYVLPSVLEAEKRIMAAGKNKEYAGIAGMKDFVDLSLKFAYGDDSKALHEKRITGVQVRPTDSVQQCCACGRDRTSWSLWY